MELKSEPQKYDTINVTDIDIAFPGDVQTYTLRDGVDTLEADLETNTVTITLGTGGTIRFNLEHAHWVAKRQRTVRVPKPEAPKIQE